MLAVGDAAPNFEGPSTSGERIGLAKFRGRPLVLYFYPRAGTSGCTLEANDFARHFPEFDRAGVAVVGVSVDPLERQERFADDCHLPFPLISDADRSIARTFGVLGLLGMAKRVTFWIGPDGRIEDVVSGMMPGPHVRAALERLSRAGPAPGTSAPTAGGDRPPA